MWFIFGILFFLTSYFYVINFIIVDHVIVYQFNNILLMHPIIINLNSKDLKDPTMWTKVHELKVHVDEIEFVSQIDLITLLTKVFIRRVWLSLLFICNVDKNLYNRW